MDPDELAKPAERLSSIIGDRCLLIGGLAVSAWGHVRATEDIDFASSLEPRFRAGSKDYVFTNTVDAFFDTAELPAIPPHLKEAEVVSGYRTDLRAHNLYQKALTLGNYWLIRILFPMRLKAYQTLQFLPREFIQTLRLEARSSFLSPEILLKARKAGLTIKEVPVTFHPRTKGMAKGGKPIHVWRTFKDVPRFWVRWVVLGKI